MAKAPRRGGDGRVGTGTGDDLEVFEDGSDEPRGVLTNRRSRTKRKLKKVIREAIEGQQLEGERRRAPVSVPRYELTSDIDAFESPHHLATWNPADPVEPTVYINTEAPVLRALVEYHQEHYPDHLGEDVEKIVHHTMGKWPSQRSLTRLSCRSRLRN